jgi:hypothetical protein
MWELLYDGPIQGTTTPWRDYIHQYKSCGRMVQNHFQSSIYSWIGLELVAISFVFMLLYYYYFNYRFGRYYAMKSWIVTLSFNSITVALATYLTANSVLDNPICSVSTQLLWITLINALYAAVVFTLLSVLFKWWSPMAKRTPF